MHQILLGSSIPFFLALFCYAARRGRAGALWLCCTPVLMAAGALWAVAPDLPRIIGQHDLYFRLARDPRCNVFFWHYAIDQVEKDSPWWGAVAIIIAAVLLFIAWRELRRAERG